MISFIIVAIIDRQVRRGILAPDQGLNLGSLNWEHRVLTTRPGKSLASLNYLLTGPVSQCSHTGCSNFDI